MKRRENGLTLIELMVTLAVAIVILAVGLPMLGAWSVRDVSAASVNGLVTALQQARAEATGRGQAVEFVCTAKGSEACGGGWLIRTIVDGTLTTLRNFDEPGRGIAISIANGTLPLPFNSQGEGGAAEVRLRVQGRTDAGKCIVETDVVVMPVGQIRLERKSQCST